jgi:5-methylcytosine-specific restriction endonuclease McrA
MSKTDYHHLYKTARWLNRREVQLRRHPLCKLCMDVLGVATAATVADHIRPHRGDPALFEGGLQSLCKACHDSLKKQIEEKGYFDGFNANGEPLDPNHPWYRREDPPPPGGACGRRT